MEELSNNYNTSNTPNTPKTPKSPESNNKVPGARGTLAKLGGASLKASRKTMADFKQFRNNNEVEQDIRFLNERKKDFRSKGEAAKQFEQITARGFITDRWLGNIPDKKNRVPFRVANVFAAESSERVSYDDVVNKIDYAVSLDVSGRQDPIFIGFDVTLNEGSLEDKLLRTNTNPDKNLPFGFSGLDYSYTREGDLLPKITNVPRYCLTMDLSEDKADEYHQNWFRLCWADEKDKTKEQYKEAKTYIGRFNARTRFMVLSEIYEQNKLYKAMLPPLNGKDNLTIKDAASKLDIINSKLFFPLYRAAMNCPLIMDDPNNEEISPAEKAEADKVEAKRAELFQKIKDCSESDLAPEEKGQRIFTLRQEAYHLISDYVKTKDSHYSAMLQEVDHLSELEQQGKLNTLKTIQPRNKKRIN